MSNNNNQQGAFDLVLVFAITLFVAVGGFTIWRIVNRNGQSGMTHLDESTQVDSEPSSSSGDGASKQTTVNSTVCEPLNTETSTADDIYWKRMLERSHEIVGLIEDYPPGADYETYFSTVCELDDDSQLVSYSHYYDEDNGDGTLELISVKGLARYGGGQWIFVDTDAPCESGPPDATAPPAIREVKNSAVDVVCGGYSAEEYSFNLETHIYEKQ